MILSKYQRTALAALMAVAGLLGAGIAPGSAVATTPVILGADSPAAVPGDYIVALKDPAAVQAEDIASRAQALTTKYGAKLGRVYEKTLQGFSVTATEDQALKLAVDPDVASVEQSQRVRPASTQDGPAWNLDRIDQRPATPLSHTYSYDTTASNVTAYVIDSGIRISHTEFEGRASYGPDFYDLDTVSDDCYGHGTHIAGTIGGKTYGVAKRVKLVAVRIFGCTGQPWPSLSDVLAAIEWVTVYAVKPAVVNVSVEIDCSGGCTDTVSEMLVGSMTNSINSGLHYAVAAGNRNADACSSLFANPPQANVVGATDNNDARTPDSNWGGCVKIFAPGDEITSAAATSDTDTTVMSGTSMAAPHVAGAVALILGRPGWAAKTLAEVTVELMRMSTKDVVTNIAGTASPNRLLFTEPPPVVGSSSIAVARQHDGRLTLFGVGRAGELFNRSQTAPGAITMSPWLKAVTSGWYSASAESGGDDQIELVGLRKIQKDVFHRTQAATDANSWYNWAPFDGSLTASAMTKTPQGWLELFGITSDGTAVYRSQYSAGSSQWTPWTSLPLGGEPLRSIAADLNGSGYVEIFVLNAAGHILHRWQTSQSSWSPWEELDGTMASIAVTRKGDGRLELYGANAAGEVYHRAAAPGTNNWFSWSQLDGTSTVGTATSLAAETNADGRVALYAVNKAGQIWQRSQTSPGADTYTSWTQIDGELRP